ncbi:hypothetical protein [Aeromonas jandaei]|uniref:hypothetical protein n=1 Tax=Aeromonas jandaei TaxID=650 RepID=UPI001ADD71FD|nr:hypothetical protein [Aeromonas jandaei]QTL94387.1 hypothetical protein AjGTCBM29_02250 [Aeromonas jandaei]
MRLSMQHWLSCFFLMSVLLAPPVFAKPELHLLFHMGAGANGQFFVGGTLENRGDQDIYQGFVVITPLTKECYPLRPILSPFGAIKAGEKYEFKIPVRGRLNGYKLDTVHAVDNFANPVAVIDETSAIMASKQEAYLTRCQLVRGDVGKYQK